MRDIDYLGNTLAIVKHRDIIFIILFALAPALVCIMLCTRRKMKVKNAVFTVLLSSYIAFVLTITLIERIPSPYPKYMSEPFWSYKLIYQGSKGLLIEDILNVVLFIPIGIFVSALVKKYRLLTAFFAGTAFSSMIELSQLITHRGLFEYDDIIHNTLGSITGGLLTVFVCKIIEAVKNKERINE